MIAIQYMKSSYRRARLCIYIYRECVKAPPLGYILNQDDALWVALVSCFTLNLWACRSSRLRVIQLAVEFQETLELPRWP